VAEPLGNTLQQLQGKWRLTRLIDPSGAESGVPAKAVWEFKGDRIIVHDGGPGGAMLIEVDDSQSPILMKMTLEAEDEIGLGLMSVEGDKVIFCLGKSQKAPEPQSRPEKLQWVSGAWYMELTRVKPGETIVPFKTKIDIPLGTESMPSPNLSPAPIRQKVDDSKSQAVEHGNSASKNDRVLDLEATNTELDRIQGVWQTNVSNVDPAMPMGRPQCLVSFLGRIKWVRLFCLRFPPWGEFVDAPLDACLIPN